MHRQIHIYKVTAWSLKMCVDDFTAEEWRFRPHGLNHALWIVGHLLLDRKMLANLMGMSEEITDRDRLFDMGTKPDDVPADVEGPALLEEFAALHERFAAHVEAMTDEELQEPTEWEFPETPKNKLGALQFLLMHESYHVGQLGALRVMTGKGSWLQRMQGG